MIDPGKAVSQSSEKSKPAVAAAPKLLAGVIFGLAFGFLLQKGGFGKYNVLIGQLLLEDFTVAKVMLTAIVVGMVGIFTLHHFAKVNLHIKPTRIGTNLMGSPVRRGLCVDGLLPRNGRRSTGTRELGRPLRYGRTGRRLVDFRGTFGLDQTNSREMGRSRQGAAARPAAPPARSVCNRLRRVAHCGVICPALILSALKEKG